MTNPLRLTSIASRVLLPWVILLLLAAGLAGYRYQQLQFNARLAQHTALHRQAASLANHLRELALDRWSDALLYRITPDPHANERVNQSERAILARIEAIERLFDNNQEHAFHVTAVQDSGLLDGYRLARVGIAELYRQFFQAVDAKDAAHQERLQALLAIKLRQIRASLDDLTAYQVKTERLAMAQQQAIQQRGEGIFFGLLTILILLGMAFSRYQTLTIARPLDQLTRAARQIGAGRDVDLSGFKGTGEISELAAAFDQMVQALRASHRDLQAQKDQLAAAYAEVEAKVRQRTADLTQRGMELETANKDLENFSYSVSHDLRAPLRAIDGFIAILLEEQADRLDDEGRRMFGIVADNARKMGHLIDDILAFSRAGRLELDTREVDMAALVREAWSSLEENHRGRAVELRLDDLPGARCDPRALRQVWQNLLDNAIKFTRDRDPARIEVGAVREGDFIRYRIQDNGVGFNAEYTDKLFVLFQRLHGMDEFEGTGVGLAIVKLFIQKHGGEVSATATPGQGACFSFTLPSPAETLAH